MKSIHLPRLGAILIGSGPLVLLAHLTFAGTVTIASPKPSATVPGTVSISASASESTAYHLEVWDNGSKLGNFASPSVTTTPALAQGAHTTSVLAVSTSGTVLNKTSVSYSVTKSASAPVTIASPTPDSTSISAVKISASANESTPFRLEIWDNGYKLGNVAASSINDVYVLPNGSHTLTVQAINSSSGSVISSSTVNFKVAESCSNSSTMQCNLDQIGIDNTQNNCNPPLESLWVANPCGGGVQGVNPTDPKSTLLKAATDGSSPADQGELALNGKSLHLSETQGTSHPSNVLFRGQSPTTTGTTIDSHWTLDEYVYLPDPSAHQAFEMDSQYTAGGIWTKFYTECAFNQNSGTGYWGVFDSATGGWIFLNGKSQGGQTPPVVPCDRSQFAQPWAGSGNASFTGWHHIAWSYLRDSDGTVTFQSLTFDGKTTPINFKPNSKSGGNVNDNGNFSALIQLDGVTNTNGQHDIVDAYVNEVNLTHTP
jgi:hypothetical protein